MGHIQKNFNVANILSVTALMVALGGTSYAAVTLPKNSVSSAQIKTSAVKGSDIASAAVTSSDVKNGSLTTADFKPGQIPAGPAGAAGAKGDKGEKGDKGDTGATGNFGQVVSRSFTPDVDLADGAKTSINAVCQAGEQAIGGGGRGDNNNSEETIVSSSRPALGVSPFDPPVDGAGFNAWRLTVTNPAGGSAGIRPTVWVFCVPAPTPAP